ncbi:MAG TPA: histidine kinase [Pseudonocardia sp.]|nr:histidine kinase [Pseudonocardia sp.]
MAGESVAVRRMRLGGRVDAHLTRLRRRGLWLLLWLAAGLAELAVLAPLVLQRDTPIDSIDVVLRLIGGSFAACGLIAWRRRPDSRVGLLMTATGFGFLIPALLRDLDSELAQTAGLWLADVWALFFVPLLLGYRTGGRLPSRIDWVLVGAVAVLIYDPSLDDDPELIDAVAGVTVIALENRALQAQAEARLVELRASRERIVTAADAERRRIERNLHDGAQQGLVTLALQLSLIQRRIRDNPADAEQLVASASDQLAQSLAELRELARGIHPAALEQGLPGALEALVLRSVVPTRLQVEPGTRWPAPVEFAAYFVVSEALANVAKHAGATEVTVRVRQVGPDAVVEITDDGAGGANPAAGSGLRGLADRVEALGGRFTVADAPAGGTVVTAALPVTA